MSDKGQDGDKDKSPKVDWIGQLRYTLLMVAAVVAFLLMMRFLGLRS